jgi:hypothetical protein
METCWSISRIAMDGYDNRNIVTICVRGQEPIPWSVPTVTRWGGSVPNPRLVEWQDAIRKEARERFGPLQPWRDPIRLCAKFYLLRGCPSKNDYGKVACPTFKYEEVYEKWRLKGKGADLTNLIKAAEDALQDIVYIDDAQVCSHDGCDRLWSSAPGIEITLTR